MGIQLHLGKLGEEIETTRPSPKKHLIVHQKWCLNIENANWRFPILYSFLWTFFDDCLRQLCRNSQKNDPNSPAAWPSCHLLNFNHLQCWRFVDFFRQVWDEGTSELHMAGLYHNVQETLKALKFRPPGHLFDNAYDPHTFQYLGVFAKWRGIDWTTKRLTSWNVGHRLLEMGNFWVEAILSQYRCRSPSFWHTYLPQYNA